MLKSNELKILALQDIASAQNNNASATRGLAREQSKTNELLQEHIAIKDRVDISMREYEDLKQKESAFYAYRELFNKLITETNLTPEEFAEIVKNEISVSFDENPADFSMRIHILLNVKLPISRMRDLMGYHKT